MEKDCDARNVCDEVDEKRGECCEELLAQGEDVNNMDQLGWTPLMRAVYDRNSELARDLLSRGAQVSICNHYGVTAFTMASTKFDEDLLQTLYHGLSPELMQRESDTALLVASTFGSYDTVRWLLQFTHARVNALSPLIGLTPLMMVAIGCGDCDVAKLLLDSGADPMMTSPLGQDALELALATGNDQLYTLLSSTASLKNHSNSQNVDKTKSESTDVIFRTNHINLGIERQILLKTSPGRPVFKTGDENLSVRKDSEYLLSPSKRSVFLLSPRRSSNELGCHYDIAAIVTPRKFAAKTPNKGAKRKLSNVSSWLKKITKRRSKSLADEDDYEDLNGLQQQNGVDFLKLLKGLALEEFFPIFKEQELDIWTFLSLTIHDLAAMGIDKASAQIRILDGIQTLRTTQI